MAHRQLYESASSRGGGLDVFSPIFLTYVPQPPLAAFVDMFWFHECCEPPHAKERRLPDGSIQLTINLREDMLRVYDRQDHEQFQSFSGCLLSGMRSQFVVIDAARLTSTIGVTFKPGGTIPFFKLPADELYDIDVPLEALWGTAASDLRNQLLEARTPERKFHILEQALLAHVIHPLTQHPAVAFALKEFQRELPYPYPGTIADVIEHVGLSSKRFIQVFREEVGLTPKLFCRIQRFQEVLRRIGQGEQIDWADIALTCGYFDQAHCIHDFRSFSGITPGSYLAQRGDHQNHVALLD